MSTKKLVTSHRGRKCKTPGCKRVLSIYNHDAHCHVHLNKLANMPEFARAGGIRF